MPESESLHESFANARAGSHEVIDTGAMLLTVFERYGSGRINA
jgi:hypothetical protein